MVTYLKEIGSIVVFMEKERRSSRMEEREKEYGKMEYLRNGLIDLLTIILKPNYLNIIN